jgi:acyl-CoA synthetase (AMP-forming)/AMP-acid ligase II
MNAKQFRSELKARLTDHASDVLLRIVVSEGEPIALTGGEILSESLRLASTSTASEGSVVLLLLPHSIELFLLHIGLILTGRIPAILPWPTTRVDPEKYQTNLLHHFRNLPAQELITIPSLAANLGPALACRVVGCQIRGIERWEKAFSLTLPSFEGTETGGHATRFEDSSEALFLQFSGGTTGTQKAVVITAPILNCQLERLRDALSFSSKDAVVSWLPLYHDMGLIACFWLPLWNMAPSVQFAAADWLLNPGLLFEFLERYSGSFCWLPNFAFSYLAGQRERMSSPRALSHVRGFIDCSEPVRLHTLRAFVDAFADWGVSMEQVQASYAMAENVFAVTQTKLGEPPRVTGRTALSGNGSLRACAFEFMDDVYVSSGQPIAGMRVRIVNSDGSLCADREGGEIQLSTESLFAGYWGAQGYSKSSFTPEGWYATGDFGFLSDEELYVIGRLKDVVIVGGQNVFPEDVETAVNRVAGIYPGRSVAFGVENAHDTESLIVVAEMKGVYDRNLAASMEKEIARLVLSAIGVGPGCVRVVPERWIVKSTAGKISRRGTRDRYLRDLAQSIETRVAAGEAR